MNLFLNIRWLYLILKLSHSTNLPVQNLVDLTSNDPPMFSKPMIRNILIYFSLCLDPNILACSIFVYVIFVRRNGLINSLISETTSFG